VKDPLRRLRIFSLGAITFLVAERERPQSGHGWRWSPSSRGRHLERVMRALSSGLMASLFCLLHFSEVNAGAAANKFEDCIVGCPNEWYKSYACLARCTFRYFDDKTPSPGMRVSTESTGHEDEEALGPSGGLDQSPRLNLGPALNLIGVSEATIAIIPPPCPTIGHCPRRPWWWTTIWPPIR
jgi:hypothetical protein